MLVAAAAEVREKECVCVCGDIENAMETIYFYRMHLLPPDNSLSLSRSPWQ